MLGAENIQLGHIWSQWSSSVLNWGFKYLWPFYFCSIQELGFGLLVTWRATNFYLAQTLVSVFPGFWLALPPLSVCAHLISPPVYPRVWEPLTPSPIPTHPVRGLGSFVATGNFLSIQVPSQDKLVNWLLFHIQMPDYVSSTTIY